MGHQKSVQILYTTRIYIYIATLWLKLTWKRISYSIPRGVNIVVLGSFWNDKGPCSGRIEVYERESVIWRVFGRIVRVPGLRVVTTGKDKDPTVLTV